MTLKISTLLFISLTVHFAFAQQNKQDSILVLAARQSHDSVQVNALISAAIDVAKRDSQKALSYYRQALRICETAAPGPWAGNAYARMALLQGNLGNSDSARLYFDKAKKIIGQHPNYQPSVIAYYNSLGIFLKNSGDYDQSLKIYRQYAELGERFIGRENMAGNFLNIANVYNKMGKLRESQEYLFKALTIFEELHNEMGMSFCYNGLGDQFYKQKNYTNAESFLMKALALKEKSGNKKAMESTLNGLADLYMDLKDYNKALIFSNKAIAICEELGLKENLCKSIMNKGMIYQRKGDQKEALIFLLQAKSLAEGMQNKITLATINAELGRIYQEQSEDKKALHSLLEAVDQAKKSRSPEVEQNARYTLADYYTQHGQYKEALEQYKRFHALSDTVGGVSVKSKLYELEAQYESKKKETQIALLEKDQKLTVLSLQRERAIQLGIAAVLLSVIVIATLLINRNRVINRTNRQIEMERMRNNIARDLHDDIGSALSSINIMSKLATESNGNNSQLHLKRIGEQSARMMESMSDIIWSINPNHDSAEMIVSKMKEFAAEILEPKNITYKFLGDDELAGITLTIDQRKNIFLIFKESINNAAKYSEAKKLTIEILKSNGILQVSIVDNGIGFNQSTKRAGNGLRNMEERARSIFAKIVIESEEEKGTSVMLRMPIT